MSTHSDFVEGDLSYPEFPVASSGGCPKMSTEEVCVRLYVSYD